MRLPSPHCRVHGRTGKLFIVGRNDKRSPTAELQRVLDEIGDPVNFAEIPDADHGLIGHEDRVADRVAEFLAESLN